MDKGKGGGPSGKGKNTKGVEILLGDPKKAVIKLAIPMVIAMSVHTAYSLADAIWVSGIERGLAAVALFFPFFMLSMAFSAGVGVGGGAVISQRIGANNKRGADLAASTTMLITLGSAFVLTVPMIILCPYIFEMMGVEDKVTLDAAVLYSRIMFGGSIFMFFSMVSNAILRGEGDAKRAMIIMVGSAILNIILDPIFIYPLGMGIAGAAAASVISMIIACAVLFYWLFIQKTTYVSFPIRTFKFDPKIIRDMAIIGIPASLSQMSMAIMAFALNVIVLYIAGTKGVEIYGTGWRIVMIAVLPLLGIATAITSVGGASYGARKYRKLEIAYAYSLQIGIMIEVVMAIITFVAAPILIMPFTWADNSQYLAPDLVIFLRIIFLMFPATAFGMITGTMFQGIGKGINALVVMLLRTLGIILPSAILFGIILDWGLPGIWFGIAIGGWIAGIFAFCWGFYHIDGLKKGRIKGPDFDSPKDTASRSR